MGGQIYGVRSAADLAVVRQSGGYVSLSRSRNQTGSFLKKLIPALWLSLLSGSASAAECRAASPAATDAWCEAVACADVYVVAGFCAVVDGGAEPMEVTPAPVAETPAPVAVTPEPVAVTPPPVAETPAPVAESPAPGVEAEPAACVSAMAHISDAWCQAVACDVVYVDSGYCTTGSDASASPLPTSPVKPTPVSETPTPVVQ